MTAAGGRQIAAVLFDYGGVLTGPVSHSITAWLAADRIEPESFSRTLKAWLSRLAPDGTPIHRLETGELSPDEFNVLLAAELTTTDGSKVNPIGLLRRLFREMRPDPVMFALAEELRDLGLQVGLLSNSWGNTYPRELIEALFDPIVISGEVGLRKPQPAIFELALGQLGSSGDQVVFIDDAGPNLAGARQAGLHAIGHVDAASTRQSLATLIPGLSHLAAGASR